MNYKVPDFGVDQDILDTQRHLKDALKLAGKKSWKEAETCSKTKKAKNKICPKCLTDSTYEVFDGRMWRCFNCKCDIKI